MTETRLQLAQNLLQEAVYQSRAQQAIGAALGSAGKDPAGQCGLGVGPGKVLDLSERGEELFGQLWPRETPPTELERIHCVLQDWVAQQDAFDRKRNHFLRDFRSQNGFDRRTYTMDQAAEFDAGLARINAEVNLRLGEAAEKLLAD